MKLRSLSFNESMEIVQKKYDGFVDRNQRLVERQDDSANKLQIQLNSHFAVLATLTLTVTGFLVSQTSDSLTDPHRWLILIILACEAMSLLFCAVDYRHSIKFHNKWAKAYHEIDNEANKKLETGELQTFEDVRAIEQKHTSPLPRETIKVFSILMITLCLVGLATLILLFYTYFFNVPCWINPVTK